MSVTLGEGKSLSLCARLLDGVIGQIAMQQYTRGSDCQRLPRTPDPSIPVLSQATDLPT
jgi:hypothetical protein